MCCISAARWICSTTVASYCFTRKSGGWKDDPYMFGVFCVWFFFFLIIPNCQNVCIQMLFVLLTVILKCQENVQNVLGKQCCKAGTNRIPHMAKVYLTEWFLHIQSVSITVWWYYRQKSKNTYALIDIVQNAQEDLNFFLLLLFF